MGQTAQRRQKNSLDVPSGEPGRAHRMATHTVAGNWSCVFASVLFHGSLLLQAIGALMENPAATAMTLSAGCSNAGSLPADTKTLKVIPPRDACQAAAIWRAALLGGGTLRWHTIACAYEERGFGLLPPAIEARATAPRVSSVPPIVAAFTSVPGAGRSRSISSEPTSCPPIMPSPVNSTPRCLTRYAESPMKMQPSGPPR